MLVTELLCNDLTNMFVQYSFIHSFTAPLARMAGQGRSAMHRLAGVVYLKAEVVYSKGRIRDESEPN